MDKSNIDLDALKKRGFLQGRQEGMFTFRARGEKGNFTAQQLFVLSKIADKFGKGLVHATTRQGIEIPLIRYEDIAKVEAAIGDVGILSGTSGSRLRTTTSCPGTQWCKRALVDTFALYDRIETELGIRCAMDLPHKFKIVLSGCPNRCTRAESSEIGVSGALGADKRFGYEVYLGGCGGRTPRFGFKLNAVLNEDEVLVVIERVVSFFKANAKPRQRLALLIEAMGRSSFLEQVGLASYSIDDV